VRNTRLIPGPDGTPLLHAGHYENFPVASFVLPRHLRTPIRAIYAFARAADDIADEGIASPAERRAGLAGFYAQLDRIEAGEMPADPIFTPLATAIRAHALPIGLLRDLLDAFSQDIEKHRYADFGELMQYCRKSANPIGRLLLHLFGDTDAKHQAWSDGVCSALQIINFLQDIEVDYRNGRIYLPVDEMARFGITEAQIAAGHSDALWQLFMQHQIERARRMLAAGAPLGKALPGRIGLEMRLIILGGERILAKLHEARGDVFRQRPTLGLGDWFYLFRRALWPGRRQASSGHVCGGGGCR